MKVSLVSVGVLLLAPLALGQNQEASTGGGGTDVMSELWQFEDAVPLATGQVDLRLTTRWQTASFPANRGDSSDDWMVEPTIYWGSCPNVEVSLRVPIWLGEGGDVPPDNNGNGDLTVGTLWRFAEQTADWPAMALSGSLRLPTGDNSDGVDAELRLVLTNDYDSGIRSHINGFAQSINGDNFDDLRDFQWGVVIGLDGPLCADGTVRWVADYLHRSSQRENSSNMNLLELGWEWDMASNQKLGMSMQIGLDDNEDTPNFGAAITYSQTLGG